MRQKILQLSKRPFIRNVAALTSGTAASQAIAMAFSPLITRLYGPEAYGILGVFMSIAGIMGAIAAMSYPIAIVLPRSDADALGLAHLSMYIAIVMSLFVAVILFYFGPEIVNLINIKEILTFMYLIPVFMLISALSEVVSQWLIRQKAFMLIAKVTIWQTLLMSTIKTGLGFVHPTAAVLVVTNTLSGLLSAAMMLLGLHKTHTKCRKVSVPQPSSWALAKRHRDFPLLRAPQILLNAVSHSLPVVMLAIYFGPAAAGFYSIAFAVLAMPAALIGSSFMQVFYPRINEAINRGEDVKALIVKATAGLALSGALPFAAVIAGGPMLFDFVFGSEWRMAGRYAQLLSIWLFFQCINKPAVSAIPALQLQRGLLIYELFSSGTKVLALYLGYFFFESDIAAIALFSASGVVAYVWLILWVIINSGKIATKLQPNQA